MAKNRKRKKRMQSRPKTRRKHTRKHSTKSKRRQPKKLKKKLPKRIHTKRKQGVKRSKSYKGARKEQLSFLVEHSVKHEAFVLKHSVHFVNGEPVVGIDARTLKAITNDYRNRFTRGLQFGRLLIEYEVGRGRGKRRIQNRWVSTPRMQLTDDDSYQDLLTAFTDLSIPLYDYDANYFGEENGSRITIIIKKVHLELFNLHVEKSISL